MSNAFGVFIFTVLAIVRFNQALGGSVIAMFLALQSGIAVWLYFRHSTATARASKSVQVLAWASALLPMAFSPSIPATAWLSYLPIPGLFLVFWALISLNRSFSVVPADRGLVQHGAYRLIRHPMYAGEILSLAGVLVAAFSLWNVIVFTAFVISVVWRIHEEEMLIEGYELYSSDVSWRLFWLFW